MLLIATMYVILVQLPLMIGDVRPLEHRQPPGGAMQLWLLDSMLV